MKDITIAITAASYSGNKGAAAMLQSSIGQLREVYGSRLRVSLMSVYPKEDGIQCPHDFVTVVPAQPQRLVFLAFPCAVCYRIFRWCPPVRALLLKNQILNVYANADLVVDEAGIAFSDCRGFVMNTYSFVCAATPMLVGAPLVKYSQALGPFQNAYNRFLARLVLPKAELVVARGRFSYRYLHQAGIRDNCKLCADGAFSMAQCGYQAPAPGGSCRAGGDGLGAVGVSISSVVAQKCKKVGIDYCGVMVSFLLYLVQRGYRVYLFANAARMHSKKLRNNDLPIGDAIFRAYQGQVPAGQEGRLYWDRRELDVEVLVGQIGRCRLLVASRFHAMVFALSRQVPVMLIGWSHKYEEVMGQFGLEAYATDFSKLDLPNLKENFEKLEKNQDAVRSKIAQRLPLVQESSRQNVGSIVEVLTRLQEDAARRGKKAIRPVAADKGRQLNHAVDLQDPQRYLGPHLSCCMGYAKSASIRANAASGGMVTALLCSLLANHEIDGAWVVKTVFTETGKLSYQTFVATDIRQVCDASSSVYMDVPMLSHIQQLRAFDGRLAVVLTPCMMRAFSHILEKDSSLREKIVLKIGLFCSGAHDAKATEYALDKCHIPRGGAKRLYYRRGHWRGKSSVLYADGSSREFPYTTSICAYKNAYFFLKESCLSCRDQFACAADISFGDVWLPEMKKEPIKYTGCIIRTQQARRMAAQAKAQGYLTYRPMEDVKMLYSQKRALTFKYRTNRWNHRLAGAFARANQRFSKRHPKLLKYIPMKAVYCYMCLIRLLLSW